MALRRRHCQGVRRGRPAPGGEPDAPRPLPRRWRRHRPGGTSGLPPGAADLGGGGGLGRAHDGGTARPQLGLPSAARGQASLAATTPSPARAYARLLGAGRAAALAGSAHLARNPAAPLEEAQEQRAGGLSWREASQVAIWRALAALREEAGDGAAALDARHRAEAIERDPVSFGPERLATATAGQPVSDLRRLEAAVYLTPVVLHRR